MASRGNGNGGRQGTQPQRQPRYNRYLKVYVYSEEAAALLQTALATCSYESAVSASASASATSNATATSLNPSYAPLAGRGASGVVVLGLRGGSSARGGIDNAGADAGGAGEGGAISAISSGALSSAEEEDDDDQRAGGGGDDAWSSSDSSSSGAEEEGRDRLAPAIGIGIGIGNNNNNPYKQQQQQQQQSGAVTDDYDASASSAGEMSLPHSQRASAVGSTQTTCTLPPRRGGYGNGSGIGGRTASRRERERLSRRTTRAAAAAVGASPQQQNIAELVRSMGVPPSVLVPLPPSSSSAATTSAGDDEGAPSDEDGIGEDGMSASAAQEQEAAAIPTALLPPGNTDWTPMSICRSCLNLGIALRHHHQPIIVLLLRSGRFAGGVFSSGNDNGNDGGGGICTHHRVCARYTTRRGQGGAQSSQDNSKGKAKSMGAQLRRAGEASLRQDVASTLAEWRSQIDNAALILLSCPKTMRKGLHEEGKTGQFLSRNDERIRKVPLDVGRPTYESVCAVYDIMMSITVRPLSERERIVMEGGTSTGGASTSFDLSTEEADDGKAVSSKAKEDEAEPKAQPEPIVPLTPLHEAAASADIVRLMELLSLHDVAEEVANDDNDDNNANGDKKDEGEAAADMIDARAGADLQTPLHLAASLADHDLAAQCVTTLLVQGRANPCVVDGRNRPPYFVAEHERVRDAFRSARAVLGEEHCDWDGGAKVPPALTQDDVQRKKDKAAEKKRRQRARQKERKAAEKAAEEARIKKEKEEAEAQKQEEDAKRIRAGLKPKTTTASNACDYCQKVCKGKSRAQMFSRLEYYYCSTDCVRKHQRELTAAAAMARFG